MHEKKVKRKGSIPIALGAILVAASLCLAGFNLLDQSRAGRSSSDALLHLNANLDLIDEATSLPAYVKDPTMEMPVRTVGDWDYVAILTIPSQDLELPVISSWSYAALRVAPCRYSGSAYSNDLVIAAHNYSTHFGGLKNLHEGDEIYLRDMEGNIFVYHVAAHELIKPEGTEDMTESDWDLTLFTCTLSGQSRQTIRCKLVDSGNPIMNGGISSTSGMQ